MNSTTNEQPAVCGWCMVGHHEEITRKNCKCPDCVAWRAAATKREAGASDEELAQALNGEVCEREAVHSNRKDK